MVSMHTQVKKGAAVGLFLSLVLAALVCALLSACTQASVPSSSNAATRSDFIQSTAAQVWQKDLEVHSNALQQAVGDAHSLALDLKRVELAIEASLSSVADQDGYAEGLDSHLAELNTLLDEGSQTLEKALSQVNSGIAWIEGLPEASESQATEKNALLVRMHQAQTAIGNMQELMNYEKARAQAKATLGNPPETVNVHDANTYYEATWGAFGTYQAIQVPDCMTDIHQRYVDLFEMLGTIYYDAVESSNTSTLDSWSFMELMNWSVIRENSFLKQQSWVAAQQYGYAADLLSGKIDESTALRVDFKAIDRIAPNLYATLDSVLDVSICSDVAQDIIVEVEVAGFTLLHTSRHSLKPGVSYFACKPQMLSTMDRASLEAGRTTQINFKITDTNGQVLDQQSVPVEILSLYDFNWRSDEFGYTAQFDIMAWLRPGTETIDAINRKATEYVSQWTDGYSSGIWGYQYDSNWYSTLLEVAAIQRAISEMGVTYINDNYSSRAEQHILTPQQVMERRQAVCIESSILLASCLLSGGMHPFIIITPGHAQVAVETARDSNSYILLETTQLPYAGLDRGIDANDPAAWAGLIPGYFDGAGYIPWIPDGSVGESWDRFLASIADPNSDEYGGIFIVDCYWQRLMDINGLEGM